MLASACTPGQGSIPKPKSAKAEATPKVGPTALEKSSMITIILALTPTLLWSERNVQSQPRMRPTRHVMELIYIFWLVLGLNSQNLTGCQQNIKSNVLIDTHLFAQTSTMPVAGAVPGVTSKLESKVKSRTHTLHTFVKHVDESLGQQGFVLLSRTPPPASHPSAKWSFSSCTLCRGVSHCHRTSRWPKRYEYVFILLSSLLTHKT